MTTALASHKTFQRGQAFKGTLPQRITGYHNSLDDSGGKKIRRWVTEGLAGGAVLVARAAAQVDIGAIGPVIVPAVSTT